MPGAVKACWMVCLPGRAPFAMLGVRMDYAEALRCARVTWPDAEVK